MISLDIFFIFSKFLIFQVVRKGGGGGLGQKIFQNEKKFCLLHLISQEPYVIWLSFMVHICKMVISLGVFFFFSKFWFFRLFGGLKGQKTVQNDKNLCLSHSISQEPCIIWLSFMVHMCKMIISPPGFLFSFSKFWFFGLLRGQKCKKWSKMTKNSVCDTPYLRNHTSYDRHLRYTCLKW